MSLLRGLFYESILPLLAKENANVAFFMNTTSLFSLLAATNNDSFNAQFIKLVNGWFGDPLFVFLTGIVLLVLFLWYLGSDNDRVKRNSGTFFIVGIASFALFALLSKGINYGIDINGGVSFTLQVEPKEVDGKMVAPNAVAMEKAVETVRERIDSTGAKEPLVMVQGQDKILVQIPETDPVKIAQQEEIITRIAHLELLPVHPNNTALVQAGQEFVPGYKLYIYENKDDEGVTHTEKLFLSKRESLTGNDVSFAQPDGTRAGVVNVSLSSSGGDKMIRLTQSMRHGQDRLAVVLDGRVVTAPVVQSALSSRFEISGMNAPGEAVSVSRVLNNPLEQPLRILEQRTVSASLGKSALVQGELAGIYGILLTFVLLLVYYRFAGIVAMLALAINALILLGLMSLFDFTLTLPGIAGIILTIGVAVDANVLIYERLREELEAKRPITLALRNSFDKAFSAIFDSNITSLITAVILFWMASGSIKGFAVTLSVGIISSMIGALVVTRVLFFWANKFGLVNDKMKFLNLFRKTDYDFLGKRKACLALSFGLILALGIGSGLIGKKALGIDFTGGASISYDVPAGINLDFKDVEKVAESIPGISQKPKVQEFGSPNGNTTITVQCGADPAEMDLIMKDLNRQLPVLAQLEKKQGPPSTEIIGPVLGNEFMISALIALGAGMLGIMIYLSIRYEWSFALGAVVAIFHDILLVVGVIICTGGQLSLIHVGAILTIAGYSINDTIIIFDRIREVLRMSDGTEDVPTLMNEAVNTTLSRTILTSGSTIICVICLWAFGGPAMKDFAFAIFLGIFIGTYSSIFVASPAVLLFTRKRSLHSEVMKSVEAEIVER